MLPLRLRSVPHAILLLLVVVLLIHAGDRHVRHLHAHLRARHTAHVVRHVRHAPWHPTQVVEPRQPTHPVVGQTTQPWIQLQVQWIVHHPHSRHHPRPLLLWAALCLLWVPLDLLRVLWEATLVRV